MGRAPAISRAQLGLLFLPDSPVCFGHSQLLRCAVFFRGDHVYRQRSIIVALSALLRWGCSSALVYDRHGQSLEPFIRIYSFRHHVVVQCLFSRSHPWHHFLARAEPSRAGKVVAAPFDATGDPRDLGADRAADFIVDDLAHPADTAHHGRHGAFLYRDAGSLCRRDIGATDPGANFSAVLNQRRYLAWPAWGMF